MSSKLKSERKGALARAKNVVVGPFNARGVVEQPAFTLQLPPPKSGGIGTTIRAHLTESGWIAEPEIWATDEHLPGDGQFPHRGSTPAATHSGAFENAVDRAIRGFEKQLGPRASHPGWAKQLDTLRKRARDTIFQVREGDEDLPLRGKTFIDLCAGGSAGIGIAMSQNGAKCLFAAEIDPVALKSYEWHVAPQATHGDICTLDGTKLKAHFLLVGMVCQAYSMAGKHKGMADPVLAKVYQHILRLIGEIDAEVVVIECAKQLLSHDDGKDAALVRATLMRAGYRVQHRTLDASRFGVPQHRERSFIVATRIGAAADSLLGYCFPEGTEPTAVVADVLEPDQPGTIPAERIKSRRAALHRRSIDMERVGLIDGRDKQGYRVYDPNGIGATLCASSGGACPQTSAYLTADGMARPLTPREAYRLQGLPEWSRPHANRRTALYHAGNGVAVPLVRAIARNVAEHINFTTHDN